MKKLIISLSLMVSGLYAFGQWNPVTDSLEMGATYLNNAYYQLRTGIDSTAPTNNWHLAFRTGLQTDGVRINSATATGPNDGSVKLYLFAKGDTTKWANFDTAGYKTWNSYENADTTWEIGAFNAHPGAFPDVSWGVYDFSSHEVHGDAIYLLVYKNLGVTKYKKVWILSKTGGDWHFRFADIDGSNVQEEVLKNTDHNTRNFIYYNLETAGVVKQEPESANWDFVLTRYNALQSNMTYAAATGILINVGVKVAVGSGEPVSSLALAGVIADTTSRLNVIGYDWKYYELVGPSVTWKTRDSLAYFIKDRSNIFWKVVFVSFGGAADGKTVFTKQQLTPGVFVEEPSAAISSSAIYPNPVSQDLTVLFDVKDNAVARLSLTNLDGRTVLTRSLEGSAGLNSSSLDLSGLGSGIYFLEISSEGYRAVYKVVKN